MNRSPLKCYPWICVGLLWVVWLLNYLDRQVVFSVFPLLQTELHLTSVELGMIGAVFLWVYAAASPLAGYIADRFGCKSIIVVSLLVWSGVTWATGQVHTLNQMLIVRGLMGISEACYLPAGLALIAAWHGESTRAKATGIHYSGNYLGVVIGGALGGWLGTKYGWRAPFTILGIIGAGYALVLSRWLRDKPIERPQSSAGPRGFLDAISDVFRIRGFLPLFCVFAITSIANWLIYTWLPLYLYERFGMTLTEAGFASTFYLQAGSALGVLGGGWLADRWALQSRNGRVFTQSIGLALAAPFLFLSGFTNSTVLIAIGMVMFGIGRGAFDANAMPVLCQLAPADLRSTGFGLLNFIGPFSGGVIALAAGALKSTIGIAGAIQICGVLLLLAALSLTRVRAVPIEPLPEGA